MGELPSSKAHLQNNSGKRRILTGNGSFFYLILDITPYPIIQSTCLWDSAYFSKDSTKNIFIAKVLPTKTTGHSGVETEWLE
jgi:hypothetical protein